MQESFKKMLGLVNEAKQKYDDMMALYKEEITEAISTPPTVRRSRRNCGDADTISKHGFDTMMGSRFVQTTNLVIDGQSTADF